MIKFKYKATGEVYSYHTEADIKTMREMGEWYEEVKEEVKEDKPKQKKEK